MSLADGSSLSAQVSLHALPLIPLHRVGQQHIWLPEAGALPQSITALAKLVPFTAAWCLQRCHRLLYAASDKLQLRQGFSSWPLLGLQSLHSGISVLWGSGQVSVLQSFHDRRHAQVSFCLSWKLRGTHTHPAWSENGQDGRASDGQDHVWCLMLRQLRSLAGGSCERLPGPRGLHSCATSISSTAHAMHSHRILSTLPLHHVPCVSCSQVLGAGNCCVLPPVTHIAYPVSELRAMGAGSCGGHRGSGCRAPLGQRAQCIAIHKPAHATCRATKPFEAH